MLNVFYSLPVCSLHAGYFLSRGEGRHPRRVIDTFELIYVQSGMLYLTENHRQFAVQRGQSLLLWPGREHYGTEPYAMDLTFYWVHFHLLSKRSGEVKLQIPQYADIARPAYFTHLFRLFLDDQESSLNDAENRNLILMQMLHAICEISCLIHLTGTAGALAQQAAAYIQTHFHEQIAASDVARELAYNGDYLGRVFRQAFGKTLTEAIQEKRLQHAIKLLLNSTLSIEEISRHCGFVDTGYFRRLFKRYKGITPGSYRRLYAHIHVNTE